MRLWHDSMRNFFYLVPWRKIQSAITITDQRFLPLLHFFYHSRTTAPFSIMLSQLKAREVTPAPEESGNRVAKPTNTSKILDAEQQAARLTCDALCSLANGITGSTSSPTPNAATAPVPTLSSPLSVHGFRYRSVTEPVNVPPLAPTVSSPDKTVPTTNRSATTTAKTSTKIKSCPKQHQLPLFLSSKFLVIDSIFV